MLLMEAVQVLPRECKTAYWHKEEVCGCGGEGNKNNPMPCLLILTGYWMDFQVEYRYKKVGSLFHPYSVLLYICGQTVSL